jgi:hypothetical protein
MVICDALIIYALREATCRAILDCFFVIQMINSTVCHCQARTGRGIHGLPKVSCGPVMPDPYTPFGGWPARRAGGLRPSSFPLDTPSRTGLPVGRRQVIHPQSRCRMKVNNDFQQPLKALQSWPSWLISWEGHGHPHGMFGGKSLTFSFLTYLFDIKSPQNTKGWVQFAFCLSKSHVREIFLLREGCKTLFWGALQNLLFAEGTLYSSSS